MFCIEVVTDTIKVKAADLNSGSTLTTLHREIDALYPNRVLMDVGLVIGRYDECDLTDAKKRKFITKLGHGVCEGSSAHFRVSFAVIVFRPFVGEVMVGKIVDSAESGVTVSTGFFAAIFVPAYWMLNPSVYENGVWVWIPAYDEDEGGVEDEKEDAAEQQRYEMSIGAEVRFRVKSIHYTRVTATAKGMQAVTSSTASSSGQMNSKDDSQQDGPVRRRSSSVGLNDTISVPSAMHIVASICEDGLGLTSWWKDVEGDEDDGDDK